MERVGNDQILKTSVYCNVVILPLSIYICSIVYPTIPFYVLYLMFPLKGDVCGVDCLLLLVVLANAFDGLAGLALEYAKSIGSFRSKSWRPFWSPGISAAAPSRSSRALVFVDDVRATASVIPALARRLKRRQLLDRSVSDAAALTSPRCLAR